MQVVRKSIHGRSHLKWEALIPPGLAILRRESGRLLWEADFDVQDVRGERGEEDARAAGSCMTRRSIMFSQTQTHRLTDSILTQIQEKQSPLVNRELGSRHVNS